MKRWNFALEGNFASQKFTTYHLSYLSYDFVPGRFFRFLLRQQQSYQAKTGVSEFITLHYVLNLNCYNKTHNQNYTGQQKFSRDKTLLAKLAKIYTS